MKSPETASRARELHLRQELQKKLSTQQDDSASKAEAPHRRGHEGSQLKSFGYYVGFRKPQTRVSSILFGVTMVPNIE